MRINKVTQLFTSEIENMKMFKTIGKSCAITDFAILLGGYENKGSYLTDDHTLTGRTYYWWTNTKGNYDNFDCINEMGITKSCSGRTRAKGIRPVISCDNIKQVLKQATNKNTIKGNIIEIEYGEYPQYAVDKETERNLDHAISIGNMKKTGKIYTVDSHRWDSISPFAPRQLVELEYKGKKYVRVKYIDTKPYELSNNKQYNINEYVWVEVSPIKWLVDEEHHRLVSKKILATGIRMADEKSNPKDFQETEIYKYLNNYFKNEIRRETEQELEEEIEEQIEEDHLKVNPFHLKFNKVSEEDIIKGSLRSKVPVFLHGRSSEGKSARVKQIDPTCEIIYLRNTTPEALNGKCIFNQVTGKIIDVKPTWLEKLEEKCNKEPDKLHILFFDEITNALPSIQGMAFNIVLDKEVNGKWKLPENARIVAAGNDMKDSLAANKLAEPLFNRFCHVYIETTVEKWLKWAAENNIHPAIYTYVAYKGESVLRSKFDGEKPNADPRKWEMASKMLYETENPEMLRGLVGEDITADFVEFCKNKVITLETILSDSISNEYIQGLSTAERYATVMGLSQVEEDNIQIVRKFVNSLGREYTSVFDMLWIHGDKKRIEIIAEIKLAEKEKEKIK